MNKFDVQTYEKQLRDRLLELNERLVEIDEDLDEPASPDSEDRATEQEDDEVLERLGHAGLAEIKLINAALTRIENGTYGICVVCKEPISRERLNTLPHTPKCKECA